MDENKINIILNGKTVTGIKGETILQTAKRYDIEIPTLCNDPRLEPYSSCFVCVVEIEGMKGLHPSCSTAIREGMVINTDNEKVRKARKTALELILSDHYADCVGPCKETCPAGVDVQGYISYIEKGMYSEAIEVIKETNPLPAVCGRVCVRPCEVACRRNLLDEGTGVGIDYLKRFAADKDLASPNKFVPKIEPSTGKKVAVIGAGPGGLASGFFLQKKGHQCDIFEAAPAAGGWLRYGIPPYRLPNDVLQAEVDNITDLGVNIFYNKTLGENLSYSELKEKYDAVVLAIGSQLGTGVRCDGDDAENVIPGIDFLKEMEITGKKKDFSGKTVAVVGGGNTAMDCCRTSLRCGAKKVYVVYRRTEKEMPANPIEIHESKLEGVEYLFLTNPSKINKDKTGKVKSMSLIKMELGEPDASGRRRPVPVEGSEFDIEVDYVLAAIGQKTVINFLEDVNKNIDNGELKANKWGDIDANAKTLQTGVENIFAAGDGVTGPATLIEAVGQARLASHSCHQYLTGQELVPPKKEFLSKKDNFKNQVKVDYKGNYENQQREEMPTIDPKERMNFNEVELGYEDEDIAKHEANRCLECGCVAYYDCKLKEYATEYDAQQQVYEGEYHEYAVDFRDSFIEIDSNKCVLCARCVRICKDVVGANALGLVERGSDTFVAPAMEGALNETNCESCGMCISACPTGAITENTVFKPGPVKLQQVDTICNYCSVGCAITLHHKNGFVMKVTGREGIANPDGNMCRYGKFGYHYINDKNRLTKPMLKENGSWKEISFEDAYAIITDKIKTVQPNENAFYGGARLTNEEQYLLQKMARAGAKTNNVNNFHYLYGGPGYIYNSKNNTSFAELKNAGKIYVIGSETNKDNGVVGFMINNAKARYNVPVELVTNKENSSMKHKVTNTIEIKSYYYFVKAVNYYLIKTGKENALYIKGNTADFDSYKEKVLSEDYNLLVEKSGICCVEALEKFANEYNEQQNAVIVFAENQVSHHTSYELFNLAMITGKLGKTACGLVSLKDKNNAQGLFDMGVCNKVVVGTQPVDNKEVIEQLKTTWKISDFPEKIEGCHTEMLEKGLIKNMFIFGEDPVGCANNKESFKAITQKADFVVVQDYFVTETAELADLILPASIPAETGGSFTNTQKVLQEFEAVLPAKVAENNIVQLTKIMQKLGVETQKDISEIRSEIFALLPQQQETNNEFTYTDTCNCEQKFAYGCDALVKHFDEFFTKRKENK